MRKKFLNFGIIIFLFSIFVPLNTYAHPGRLDSNGCHTCKTNCASWGLEDYEYHCHSGNTYSNSKGQVFTSDGVKISDGDSASDSSSSNNESTDNSSSTNNNSSSSNSDSSSSSSSSSSSTGNSSSSSNSNTNNSNSNSSSGTNNSSNFSSNTNKGSTSNSNSNSTTNKDNTSSNNSSSSDVSSELEEGDEQEVEKEIVKSSDASIKILKVNGKSVEVVDSMFVETTKRTLTLKITTTNKKAVVNYEQKELVMGENEFDIKVTAEDGTEKEYKLIVKRIEGPGTATIDELKLGSNNVTFDNYKAKILITKGEIIDSISYKLSDENATLKLYVNDEEVEKITNLKGDNIVTLVTIDEDNNKLTYEVKISEMGPVESVIFNIIVYGAVIVMFGAPIVGVIFVVRFIKKKIKKNS